jgi:sugar phosphate isomerase/epimerase
MKTRGVAMNRREFTFGALAAAIGGGFGRAAAAAGSSDFGVQLFSVPKWLEKDFKGTLRKLAAMGYRNIEFYGPYAFSDPSNIAQWKALGPSLGFNGSGFFGLSAAEVGAVLKDNNLRAPSMHTDLGTLEGRMGPLAEAAHAIGATYVVLPSIPEERRKTLDDYKRMATAFNRIGEQAHRSGVKFAYHNHGYGQHPLEGQIPLEVMLAGTNRDLVDWEMDIYWTVAGGGDPAALLRSHPNRYRLMHLKDMKVLKHFAGDGGDPAQWEALFSYMTTVGDGVLDIKSIVQQARKSGVEYFFVEQDNVANPQVALQRSIDYLKRL